MHQRSEEIPLEDFRHSRNSSPASRTSSRATSRSHTPSRLGTIDVLSTPPQDPVQPVVNPNSISVVNSNIITLEANPQSVNSRETSFIAQKKKGIVETV